jgi:hypothetical protein
MKIEDLKADNDQFGELSLEKIVGSRIKQVRGYVSRELGDPTFKLHSIDFANGLTLEIEGEHDFPYVCGEAGGFNDENLAEIWRQESE